jgi:ATP-dependent DNA helicase RecG
MAAETAWDLEASVQDLPGIGSRRAQALSAAGLSTIRALLALLPTSLEPAAEPATLADLDAPAQCGARRLRLRVRVVSASLWPPRGRRSTLTLRLETLDPPGRRIKAFYFQQPYLKAHFPPGRELHLSGRIVDQSGPAMISPRREDVESDAARAPRPIYPEIAGVPPETLRRAVQAALPALAAWSEPLAPGDLARLGLPPLGVALRAVHAPRDAADFEFARRRLALEELLRAERTLRSERAAAARSGRAIAPEVWRRIQARLPFAFNAEQSTVLDAVRATWERGDRLRLLLHGEVGSGKTAVAFALALAIAADGGQVAMLAPTEILARQHLQRFRSWLSGARLPVIGLLGDDDAAARAAARAQLAGAAPLIAIGTHVLLAPELRFGALRLVVFDEQHRFGVRQKAALLGKATAPHVLTMTATPIPRTLAWARYGALEVSELRARAGAGAPIRTRVLPQDEWRGAAAALSQRLVQDARAFFVAPRVDGPDGLLARVAELRAGAWRDLPLAVVHGRMRGAEVAAEVERFTRGAARVLCGTTVVEVGLDVPGVEHMLVVGAERLGLASLHQLRGRLARGADARGGECLLFARADRFERLKLLERCADGFRVAEADLAERGPGSLRGTRQHGASGFRLFDPARDADLLQFAAAHEPVTGRRPND